MGTPWRNDLMYVPKLTLYPHGVRQKVQNATGNALVTFVHDYMVLNVLLWLIIPTII